ERRRELRSAWQELGTSERFLFNKLVTGSFRVGVSQRLVTRALAETYGVEPASVAHRMMGEWEPTAEFFARLVDVEDDVEASRPYPFCLANPLTDELSALGTRDAWIAEWKWDGIRGQLIRRDNQSFLWTRGEESVLDRFPELVAPAADLPDGVVLDGEVLAWKQRRVLPFADLQRRIGRKKVGKKVLAEAPVVFLAFDILEYEGVDLRGRPLAERRELLARVAPESSAQGVVFAPPPIQAASWSQLATLREQSRALGVEGMMLKRSDSVYAAGRVTGTWWKWKVAPYSCDAVLIYAQRGSGRRASLFTDYTFAVWDEGRLAPFAKAYSGLTDEEIREVDAYVRGHAREKFGPVVAVDPELVFEIAFENIQPSKRHKAGIAVRFPRILRWRRDKRPEDADTLEQVKSLLEPAC
ncbi:MAG: ATP-dependent DNA ligase, partial [Planctomycetales bacterium]|nr:ATP-dependent DNA ligase [Planctomycetales bacterium]